MTLVKMEPSTSEADSRRKNPMTGKHDELILSAEHSGSKTRRIISQICATTASSFLTLSVGMSVGFSTILIPELYKKDAEILVTLDQLTWIGSMNFILITVGAVVSGMLAQWLGRRSTIMILTMPYIVSWIILHYATNVGMLLVALTLIGLTGGLAESPVQTYLAEISEPALRGSLSATNSTAVMFGIFLQFLIGGYFHWRTLVLINLAIPIACLLAMTFVPESPHWLASKGRLRESKRALCWLRGWTSFDQTTQEYQSMLEAINDTPVSISLNPRERIVDQRTRSRQPLKEMIKPYFKRTVLLPFATVSFAFFVSCFNGSTPILIFAVLLFKKFKSPINEYTAIMIMGLLKVLASLSLVCLIRHVGKRKLMFVSLIGTGLSLLVVTIYSFVENYFKADVARYSWIPATMILLSIFASGLGIKAIPWIISGEVFPTNVRSVANGFVSSTCYVYAAAASKTFLYMEEGMTLAGTFLFYTLINVAGVMVLYFVLPETEGRTLKDIEEHYAGVRKLNDQQQRGTAGGNCNADRAKH